MPMPSHDLSAHDVKGEKSGAQTGHKHEGMAHDMSDPAMAVSMEADIRTRFFVLILIAIICFRRFPCAGKQNMLFVRCVSCSFLVHYKDISER